MTRTVLRAASKFMIYHNLLQTQPEIRSHNSPTNWGEEGLDPRIPRERMLRYPTCLGCFLIGKTSRAPSNPGIFWLFVLLGPPALGWDSYPKLSREGLASRTSLPEITLALTKGLCAPVQPAALKPSLVLAQATNTC